ncbi:MAG: general secretion pathway protein GspK [Pirellulales bacterium]|nr:general secretion pathway protein GspK [Pirellulales bacterium]
MPRAIDFPGRRGSVLLLVLVVIAILALGAATYLELMQNELHAVRNHGRQVQAARLAESALEYLAATLAQTPEELQAAGGLQNNEGIMRAIIVDDSSDKFARGRFTILASDQADGIYAGVRYGLENESSKLNVNTLLAPGAEQDASRRLLALPGMSQEIAEAIVDWLDADDSAQLNGAESDYYRSLSPGYSARNGPIADLDELLLVKGVTPELLYGLDQNRNLLLDELERPRGLLLEIDNADGSMNRGWSAYLTVSSVERQTASVGAARADLNSQSLQQLYNDLKPSIGDDQAKFIVLYRQYGPLASTAANGAGRAGTAGAAASAAASGRAGTTSGASGASGTGTTSGATAAGGTGTTTGATTLAPQQPASAASGASSPAGGAANQQSPVTAALSSLQLKFDQQGAHRINSPLDLVGATVQIPAENNNPPQNVQSPWIDDAASYSDLLELYDAAVVSFPRRVAGRVNINQASRPVLQSLTQLSAEAVEAIISRREGEPDLALSDQRHAIWLLVDEIVTLDQMRQLERFITVGGDVFSGQAVGYFDDGPAASRCEFLIDRSAASVQVSRYRDLSPWGRGFSTELLGVDDEQRP